MNDTQQVATVVNAVDIENARIQWSNTNVSTKSDPQTVDFPEAFDSSSPSVILNPTEADQSSTLPVTSANATQYVIDRSSSVNGDQPYNMLAIAAASQGGATESVVMDGTTQVAAIKWGVAASNTDSNQVINYPTPFAYNSYAVVTNRMKANGQSNLPVVSIGKNSFTVNRPTSMNHSQDFFWVAIGDCLVNEEFNFSFPIGGGYTMKGGKAVSTVDDDQNFLFDEASIGLTGFSTSCEVVVTTRTNSGCQDIMPVTSMNPSGFTINRHDSVNGNETFYWIAIGK